GFGDRDLPATPSGEREISDPKVLRSRCGFHIGVHTSVLRLSSAVLDDDCIVLSLAEQISVAAPLRGWQRLHARAACIHRAARTVLPSAGSAWARSVLSQVNSDSVRPKWPYAAVF